MYEEGTAVFGLGLSARCIAAMPAERARHRFIAGTCSLMEANKLFVLEYMEEARKIESVAVVSHPAGEVWDVAPCPLDARVIATTYNSPHDGNGATIWSLPKAGDDALSRLADLEAVQGDPVRSIRWEPRDEGAEPDGDEGGDGDEDAAGSAAGERESGRRHAGLRVCVMRAGSLSVGRVGEDGRALKESVRMGVSPTEASVAWAQWGAGTQAVSWDPHHTDQLACAWDNAIVGFDVRSGRETRRIVGAHGGTEGMGTGGLVRDVSHNANRPWYLLSGGGDGALCVWDVRRGGAEPLLTVRKHSHWVCAAQYNPHHDQLVASCSVDSGVHLWRISSVSSAPLVLDAEEQSTDKPAAADCLVKAFDCHEDSVYSLAWSAADPWVLASLSHDGRVAVNTVPAEERYRILL